MSRLRRTLGIAKTLLVYYGKPLRLRGETRLYGRVLGLGSAALAFDIGAHVGNRVRALRRLGARVIAVEPQAAPLAVLRRLYGADPGVTIVAAACGAREGERVLHVSEGSPTLSTLSESWIARASGADNFRGISWNAEQRVPVTTLDALVSEHGLPDFVKIDVEGFEAQVLAGLSTALPLLSFEFLPASIDVALHCVERLEKLGSYEYNYSPGETMRFARARWLAPAEMSSILAAMPRLGPSGDVYARRRSRRVR
ncbi:MAG: FkbM family methyltransferase [Spirochaetaceae bacterium]